MLIYKNLHVKKKGGFKTVPYWSSTTSENINKRAETIHFFNGTVEDYPKFALCNVRPIRAF
jgi:hypothetical protein